MARLVLLLLLSIASVYAVGTCYVAYGSSYGPFGKSGEVHMFSFSLQNGTQPSEVWTAGVNGSNVGFINQTHIALYQRGSLQSEGTAILYNVYTKEVTAQFSVSAPADSDDLLEQYYVSHGAVRSSGHSQLMPDMGTFMIGTNNGGVYWLNILPENEARPFVPGCGFWGGRAMTLNLDTMKPEVVGDLCQSLGNLTYILLANSDTFRVSAVSVEDRQSRGFAITYDGDNKVAANVTVDGFMPSVFGGGYARGFVMNSTTGQTQYPSVADCSCIKEVETLNYNVELKTVQKIDFAWDAVSNDGSQYYFFYLDNSMSPEKFFVHTVANDFKSRATYGPFPLPKGVTPQNFAESLGMLSCSMNS